MEELSKLAENDPEFFQFLQENDRELLNFNPDAISQDGEDDEDLDGDAGMDEDEVPVLTKEQLKSWQKALLQVSVCVADLFVLTSTVAKIPSCSTKATHCIPCGRTHE